LYPAGNPVDGPPHGGVVSDGGQVVQPFLLLGCDPAFAGLELAEQQTGRAEQDQVGESFGRSPGVFGVVEPDT
jgi:hypothetical protein